MLAGKETIDAMAEAFEQSTGSSPRGSLEEPKACLQALDVSV